MEINTTSDLLSESESDFIVEAVKFILDVKDGKIKGVTVKLSAREMEDARSIIRKLRG